MRTYRTVYAIFGIRVSRENYRRWGGFVPQWARSARSVPVR